MRLPNCTPKLVRLKDDTPSVVSPNVYPNTQQAPQLPYLLCLTSPLPNCLNVHKEEGCSNHSEYFNCSQRMWWRCDCMSEMYAPIKYDHAFLNINTSILLWYSHGGESFDTFIRESTINISQCMIKLSPCFKSFSRDPCIYTTLGFYLFIKRILTMIPPHYKVIIHVERTPLSRTRGIQHLFV